MAIRGLEQGQKAALIISECQNGMIDPAYGRPTTPEGDSLAIQAAKRSIVDKIAVLADVFRQAGLPVLHSIVVPMQGYRGMAVNCVLTGSMRKRGVLFEGSPHAAIHPRLTPCEGDFILRRYGGLSPWELTELDGILRAERVQTLVVTGVSTNIALFGIGLGAVNRGYEVVYPEDCTAGAWAEAHAFMVTHTLPLLGAITTSEAVIAAIRAGTNAPA